MSIDQKIAQLMEESEKLQAEESQEVVAEEATEEVVAEEAATEEQVEVVAEEAQEETAELSVDVSADVAALVNGEELSEEFKTKAATIFEAAVVTRVKSEMAKLEEQFETQLAEQVEEIKDGLVEKVDGYLNYVVEQWMTDNEIALENGLKNEILESFVSGMKGLFQEHYIEVPEDKFDILGDMQQEIVDMKSKLDEQLSTNVDLSAKLNQMVRVSAIDEVSSQLADTDAEKFKALAEELSFEDSETFKTKLETIKENYFGQKQQTAKVDTVVTDEPVEQLDESVKAQIDPRMERYLTAFRSSK